MIVITVLMLRRRRRKAAVLKVERFVMKIMPLISRIGLVVGMMSEFFGIGDGVLIVPGLSCATGTLMICGIGSSLLSIETFGLTIALNYAISAK